jgi:hypothetical protein
VVFGVRFDPALRAAVEGILPPGYERAGPGEAEAVFTLSAESSAGLPSAMEALDGELRLFVATNAPGRVFVHAGVVAHGDRGLILPGTTGAGKTELVAALVNAGAAYYSDEFAVLDDHGLVHPYARSLTRRTGAAHKEIVTAEGLGGTTGTRPVPVACIAATTFQPGTTWDPAERPRSAGVMLLLAHAGQARDHSERVMKALLAATEHALVLEGTRGEAAEAAEALLALL